MAMTARHRAWLLPLVFLLGYLVAWGTVLVDRQMLIQEQQELREELRWTKRRLQVFDAADEFGSRWQEIVDWNEKALKPKEEEGK